MSGQLDNIGRTATLPRLGSLNNIDPITTLPNLGPLDMSEQISTPPRSGPLDHLDPTTDRPNSGLLDYISQPTTIPRSGPLHNIGPTTTLPTSGPLDNMDPTTTLPNSGPLNYIYQPTIICLTRDVVTRPQPTATTVARTPPSLPSAAQPHFESVQSSDSSSLSSQPGHAHVRLLPTPGLVIPDIPHWTEGDPALGLHTPLKDWPPEWTRGSNRLFAAKHQQRSLIALEFTERFQSDEAMFIAAYPEAVHGHCALLRAINTTRQARGECEVRSWPGLPQLQDS
ncbi:hypothetical protein EV363DRAFT_1453870 [Boletus edulis]|nr:hypothetical protein EV363DRAFT_1453870 [Boletus edulis]